MPSLVDPHIGFVSYQQALTDRSIQPIPCDGYPELYVMQDEPESGDQRLTYAFIANRVVKAYAVYTQVDFWEGKPRFGVGYATAEQFRNHGFATEIVKASMKELHRGISQYLHEPGFYVEAIVGMENLASQKVAARTLTDMPETIVDGISGLPALYYIKQVV